MGKDCVVRIVFITQNIFTRCLQSDRALDEEHYNGPVEKQKELSKDSGLVGR